MPIYDAAMSAQEDGTPLVVIGGKEIWHRLVARLGGQGTILLGVRHG